MLEGRGAILWGGGLGDALVMRPLLEVLANAGQPAPTYFTTASHLSELFRELALPVDVCYLPRNPLKAVFVLRAAGAFDWVYTGPRFSWKVRLLQYVVRSRKRLYRPASDPADFVADNIAEDISFFSNHRTVPYGTLPLFPAGPEREGLLPEFPYVVIHLGAKSDWETKQWPMEKWQKLLMTLTDMGWNIQIVGMPSEREHLSSITAPLHTADSMVVRTDLSLWELERLISSAAGVVCHNSGVMHIAVAHHRPTLVLTGSSAFYWRPAYDWVSNIDSGECSLACNRYRCPVPGYGAKCIRELDAGDVVAAFRKCIGDLDGGT